MEQRVSLITLGVADLARAVGFYRRLGWTPSPRFEGAEVAFFQAGGMVLALWGRRAAAADAGLPADASGDAPSARVVLAYNARSRDEVAAVIEEARRAGGRVLKPAGDTAWGGHAGYFADPDGHVWEVAWNPDFPILADGSVRLPE